MNASITIEKTVSITEAQTLVVLLTGGVYMKV